VKVQNIGLHIGGGPNDRATKAPFLNAVARKFDDFRGCYGRFATVGASGTFGIDLLVAAKGGHPVTSNVRSALPGDSFRACVTDVFAAVDFAAPKLGATKLSYALRFDPL
jgi:hypothetical protein